MRELARTHWIGGTLSALCGALAYRFGPALVSGTFRFAVQIAGLILVTAGLFWIARGVSRTAAERAEHESD